MCMVDVEAIPEGLPFRVPGLDIQEFRGRFRVGVAPSWLRMLNMWVVVKTRVPFWVP